MLEVSCLMRKSDQTILFCFGFGVIVSVIHVTKRRKSLDPWALRCCCRGQGPFVHLAGRVTANQFKVKLGDHLYPTLVSSKMTIHRAGIQTTLRGSFSFNLSPMCTRMHKQQSLRLVQTRLEKQRLRWLHSHHLLCCSECYNLTYRVFKPNWVW